MGREKELQRAEEKKAKKRENNFKQLLKNIEPPLVEDSKWEEVCVCVCVCVRACVRACVCICMCAHMRIFPDVGTTYLCYTRSYLLLGRSHNLGQREDWKRSHF